MFKIYKYVMLLAAAFLVACGGGGGLPGTQTGEAELRVYPPIKAVTLPVGYGYASVEIRGGDRPYYVTSNHPAVRATLVDGNIMQIRALAAIDTSGTTTTDKPMAWFTDKNGKKIIEIEVSTFTIPLANNLPTSIVMLPAETRSGTVSSGFAPYSFNSSNNNVASISGNPNSGQYTITAVAPGTATLLITDAVGAKVQIEVKVEAIAPVKLEVAPTAGSARVGATLTFDIKGGVAPYTALSNNASLASASVSGRTLSVKLNLVGSTVVVVRDAAGATANVDITSTQIVNADLIITPPTQEVSEKSTAAVVYTLGDGVPPFIPVVSLADQALVSASISGDNTQLILSVGSNGNRCVTATTNITVKVFDQTGVGKDAVLRIMDQGVCP